MTESTADPFSESANSTPHTSVSASSVPTSTEAIHRALDAEQVVERYLLGRLDADTAERFEQHYFDCPACLERLEVHEALLDGLRTAAVEDTVRLTTAARWAGWFRVLGPRARALAAAAAVGLLVPTLWLGWHTMGLTGEVATLRQQVDRLQAPQASPWRIALAPQRAAVGDAPKHQLRLPPEDRVLVLTLELGLTPGEPYTLTFEGSGIDRSQTLDADPAGHLVVALPTSALEPGDLKLSVADPLGVPTVELHLEVTP